MLDIDAFYKEYFGQMAEHLAGISKEAGNFEKIVDFGDDNRLGALKDEKLSYPCLIIQEWDEEVKYGGVNDQHMRIPASIAILKAVSADDGAMARTQAVETCKKLCRKVFAKMVKDSEQRRGRRLYDQHIQVELEYKMVYIYPNGLYGARLDFMWKVIGNILSFDDAEWL